MSVLLWTSTISVCGSAWKPASLEDLVGAVRLADVRVVLVDLLRADGHADRRAATTTKASQPKTAVFQWLALQRPMRAAMLFELLQG